MPRIVIEIRGGCFVQAYSSNSDVQEVTVIDWDGQCDDSATPSVWTEPALRFEAMDEDTKDALDSA